jgi:outer membrane protein assembly factor BamA
MIKIIKIILFLFILASYSKAEIVNNIVIEGNKRVNDETIKIYGDIKVNKNYNNKDLNKILLNLYETNFLRMLKLIYRMAL